MRASLTRLCAPACVAFVLSCAATPQPDPNAVPASGQSYAAAVAAMCGVDAMGKLEGDGLEIGRARSDWLKAHVENPQGIYLLTILSVKPAKEQAELLLEEAKSTGGSTCALSEALAANELGALAP